MNLHHKADRLLDQALQRWVATAIRIPLLTIALFFTLTGFSVDFTINNLGVNTDTSALLSMDLPFQRDHQRLIHLFPEDSRAILVVIDSDIPENTRHAVKTLSDRFRAETSAVESVYTPTESAFFENHALLYQDTDALDDLAMDVIRAQPLIGRLSRHNNLNEVLELTTQALEHPAESRTLDLEPLVSRIDSAIAGALEQGRRPVSWQTLMSVDPRESNDTPGFILVKPIFDYSDLVPADKAFTTVRRITREFNHDNPDVRVRLTGEVALEHEELESVSQGMEVAGLISLVLVCIALLWALRTVSRAVCTVVTLVVGLLLSAGFATLAVGHLNLISIAFAVLYVGLGVDYAIHVSLRFKDFILQGLNRREAISRSVRCVGPSIILCTLTTSIGFYAFVPTAYQGVSELGIISGTAMFIGLFVTLTLLPALLVTVPHGLGPESPPDYGRTHWSDIPLRHARPIRIISILVAMCGLWALFQISFDFDPISLRNQSSESVTTFRDLLKSRESSPLAISVLAPDRDTALRKAAALKQLDVVDSVTTLEDFIPDEQDEKLDIIATLDESLGNTLADFPALSDNVDVTSLRTSIKALRELAAQRIRQSTTKAPAWLEALETRLVQLEQRLQQDPPEQQQTLLADVQYNLLTHLATTLAVLDRALKADTVPDHSILPQDLVRRWISADGIYRLWIQPRKDLNDLENLKEFVREVQKLEPNAADLPVFYAESGREVVIAFQQAFTYALVAISLISLVVLRNLRETALVLLPLFFASILTCDATVLFDNPFNFANIIALPLLLGLGIDSSIHVVLRMRDQSGESRNILQTSTARGVFFSSLTTAASFSSLAFIAHAGTASLGFLLTVGIALTLICTLIVLPAFVVRSESGLGNTVIHSRP